MAAGETLGDDVFEMPQFNDEFLQQLREIITPIKQMQLSQFLLMVENIMEKWMYNVIPNQTDTG